MLKIGIFNDKNIPKYDFDLNNLKDNINILRSNSDDVIIKYILKIYNKVFHNFNGSLKNVYNEIQEKYDVIQTNNKSVFTNCNLVISKSHANTYELIKQLNEKKESLTVVCFDMHCDLYNADDDLWKGNHFSKLMNEGYLSNLICFGVPKHKHKMTLEQIDQRFINDVCLVNNYRQVKKCLREKQVNHIIFSIDIDCFDSYKKNYTAIPYSPFRILKELSNKQIDKKMASDQIKEISKECVFIKNKDGYENMFHVGENKFNIRLFKKVLIKIIKYCIKHHIMIGYNKDDMLIISDITEVDGIDINGNTFILINKLIDVLKEVNMNESIISKKISKNASTKSIV